MTASRLAATNLRFSFGSHRVLDGISLDVEPGSLLGLVGPNGSGKTTLLRALAGLLDTEGTVSYGGQSLSSLSSRRRARARGYVPQRVGAAFPYRACDVAAMGLAHRSRFYGVPASGKHVLEVLDEVGFEPAAEQRFDRLSGGEQQQVLIARALLQSQEILLLDEPTSALDLRHRAAVMGALRRRAEAGAAVVVAIHDLNLAALACERLLLMNAGSTAASGRPDQVLTSANLEAVYRVAVCCARHPVADVPWVEIDPALWQSQDVDVVSQPT